jgi:hypothetical protein
MASGWSRTLSALVGEIILWGSIVFSVLVRSFYGLLIFPVAMVALAVLVNRIFPLVAIDASLTRARRRAEKGFWLAVLALLIVVALRRML